MLRETHKRIRSYIHHTPVLTNTTLNNLVGASLYFKCENFQKMGAFKMRGASNAIACLSEKERKNGVVTHSSGNFAQAVALAAKQQDTIAYIVMPNNAPKVKIEAVKGYGGEVILCPPTLEDREKFARRIMEEKGAQFLHPSNQKEVIDGQGTAALELFDEIDGLNYIVTPLGGGGLLAGTALAAQEVNPTCNVIGVEPENVDDGFRSFHSGYIESNTTTNTIADGLKTQLGDVNLPIIRSFVSEIMLVSEEEIKIAMRLIWERMKIVVEASSAVALAGVMKNPERFKGEKVGIIISGGNVDLNFLPF